MTTPNTPASAPGQVCPDCGRPLGELPPFYKLGTCVGRKGPSYLPDCREHVVTRLRQELATLRASHDALVAERELERAVFDTATRLVKHASWLHCYSDTQLGPYTRELIEQVDAYRAKAGR